jgi:hypothetical protein
LPDLGLEQLYEARLALIRPDQHIAWRGDRWPGAHVIHVAAGQPRDAPGIAATTSSPCRGSAVHERA